MDPFLGELRTFPYTFAPYGWADCNGQLLPIAQYTALFSLLGTTYGGDGRTNFALPNLQGNVAIGQGQGPGLSEIVLGETGGSSSVDVLLTELPVHIHNLVATTAPGNTNSPSGALFAQPNAPARVNDLYASVVNSTAEPDAVENTGSSESHNNMQPYLTIRYCIAMQGVFPSRG